MSKRIVAVAGILLLAIAAILTYVVRHRILHVEASSELVAQLKERLATMPRELDEGRSVPDSYEISERTVQFHMNSVFNKTGTNSRTEAVAMAARSGWLQP